MSAMVDQSGLKRINRLFVLGVASLRLFGGRASIATLSRQDPASSMQPLCRFGLMLMAAALAAGCSTQRVALTPDILLPRSSAGEGSTISLSPVVDGIPDPIGRTTVTLFHVPAGKVRLDRGAESIVAGLREALQATGYRVGSPVDMPDSPALVCRVTRMRFKSNNWAAPIIFIGGEIELSLSLVDPSGRAVWEEAYRREFHDDGVDISFERGVNQAFNKALAAAMHDFASPDFIAACCGTKSHAPAPVQSKLP